MTAEKILSGYEEKNTTPGLQLREFLFSELKGINEEADATTNIVGYNYRNGYKNLICVLVPSKKAIKPGFIGVVNYQSR